jgi:hypothetical protein
LVPTSKKRFTKIVLHQFDNLTIEAQGLHNKFFVDGMYEACTSETCLRMLTVEGTAAVRKNNHRHLDRSSLDAEVSLSHLHRITWGCLNHCMMTHHYLTWLYGL